MMLTRSGGRCSPDDHPWPRKAASWRISGGNAAFTRTLRPGVLCERGIPPIPSAVRRSTPLRTGLMRETHGL
jgi:hypothetical protein